MQYIEHRDFMESIRILNNKGMKFTKAVNKILEFQEKIKKNINAHPKDIFYGCSVTNHGESRIKNCVKYALPSACRLITIQTNDICFLMFVGDHNASDTWLDQHKGYRTVSAILQDINSPTISSVLVSDDTADKEKRISRNTDLSMGKLYQKLPTRYYDVLVEGLPRSIQIELEKLESISDEDKLLEIAILCKEKQNVIFDTFCHLRAGDVIAAKNRIDFYKNKLVGLEEIPSTLVDQLEPGEEFFNISLIEPEILEHLIKTTSFQQWMLFLHPEQRKIVDRTFNGPTRLSGVSGSGKTSVLIKRAIRLAERHSQDKILILTLNKALASLINELVIYAIPEKTRTNITVISFWQLCQQLLLGFEPNNWKLYNDVTWKSNEHVDEIWEEFYHCEENNIEADILFPIHQSLLARGVHPKDYIRQEFDYVRSALRKAERQNYLEMERAGRVIPFDKAFRERILKGLDAWERKMNFVGVIDYLGLSVALYNHLDEITPEYRCVLIDEAQDFGTIELGIIRKLVNKAEDDIFLCGDAAQQVYTKHHKLLEADMDTIGRNFSIRKNYRNSREILTTAYHVLSQNCDIRDAAKRGNINFEILEPEYANFSTHKPLLLKADSLDEEFAGAFHFLKEELEDNKDKKYCIALCGYTLNDIESIGNKLNIPVLNGDIDLTNSNLFLSDLEQTKGFEFDKVCLLNCTENVLPDRYLPLEESYRQLFRLYVAMTRAKVELIVSFSENVSPFIKDLSHFSQGEWRDYQEELAIDGFSIPLPTNLERVKENLLDLTGKLVLYKRSAINLSIELQDKLINHATGVIRHSGRFQTSWKTLGELVNSTDTLAVNKAVGPESLRAIKQHFEI
ncbi:MAG: UvrD-helicase domain-containing protein [Candidatus Competibacteraceae bacterium]|nr:MAG: UvrD-helicase domain-containing protein [Candidatus Competibacteraceae bacterium]